MKTLGIIGGIGPESTIEYYRLIISEYTKYIIDGSYPSIIINSINMKYMLDMIALNDYNSIITYILKEINIHHPHS